eukprot:COSAG01_NODE_27677_length_679_cov_2.310345_1_plen_93_part_00
MLPPPLLAHLRFGLQGEVSAATVCYLSTGATVRQQQAHHDHPTTQQVLGEQPPPSLSHATQTQPAVLLLLQSKAYSTFKLSAWDPSAHFSRK